MCLLGNDIAEDGSQVAEHQFARDGEYDDAEELAGDVECGLSHVFAEPVGSDKDEIQQYDAEEQCDAEVAGRIFGRDGEQCGERTRSGVHRECQRYDTAFAFEVVVLEDDDIENHLQRHKENDETTGDGEVFDLHTEEFQHPFTQDEEHHEYNE